MTLRRCRPSFIPKVDIALLGPAYCILIRYTVLFMTKLYRIEIDVVLEDRMRSKVIQAAREHYKNSDGAWTEEDGQMVKITAEEFVADTKSAFLELTQAAFRTALPEIEPHAFRCGVESPCDHERTKRSGRLCRVRTLRP
jgi:hypothetical protein